MAKAINLIIADPVKRANLEGRYWPKVEKGDGDVCWEWKAKAKHPFGYGAMTCGRSIHVLSHQIAWALENGAIPEDAYILHSCDNPSCCNPGHLRLGDHASNMLDMKKRGRRLGYSHSEETRRKITLARAANPPKVSPEGRARQVAALLASNEKRRKR